MRGDWQVVYGADYPLNGVITYFEAYMFATTDKHMAEHRFLVDSVKALSGRCIVIDEKGFVHELDAPTLDERKGMLSLFNKAIKAKGLKFPDADPLSCVMIDLEDNNGYYVQSEYDDLLIELSDIFSKWCIDNKRVGACMHHQEQGQRYPHMHLLYERAPRKHNEFQDYLGNLD